MKKMTLAVRALSTLRLLAFVNLCFLPSGCGSYAGNPGGGSGSGGSGVGGGEAKPVDKKTIGTLSILLTDAPADDIAKLFVRVAALEVSGQGGTWIKIPLASSKEIELTALTEGLTMVLGKNAALETGDYKQIRLILTPQNPARLVHKDGTETAVRVPSGSQTGLKVNYAFRIEASKETRLAIDFDVRKSLVKLGGGPHRYLLKPVLRIVDHAKSGQIGGSLFAGDSRACVYPVGLAKDGASECGTALTSAPIVDGVFKTSLLPVGRYSLRLFASDGTFSDLPREISVASGRVALVSPE